MKSLNDILFITKVSDNISEYCSKINASESYSKAKAYAAAAFGHIDCCTTYLNCMVCEENNGFTEMLDETIDTWFVKVYEALIDTAGRTGEDSDVIIKLCCKRDEYL